MTEQQEKTILLTTEITVYDDYSVTIKTTPNYDITQKESFSIPELQTLLNHKYLNLIAYSEHFFTRMMECPTASKENIEEVITTLNKRVRKILEADIAKLPTRTMN